MKADYGLDAPGLMRGFLLGGLVLLAMGIRLWLTTADFWLPGLGALFGALSVYPFGMAALMVFYSRVTKLADRDKMLDCVDWANIRAVVDLGCGRGLLAIGAAKRMAEGSVTGVDIWSASDQSGNSATAAVRNADIEGVADRVCFLTADMRALPMAQGSVDLVLSAWAIHNLDKAEDRKQALVEAARVLAPDGTIILSDIAGLADYEAILTGMGFKAQTQEFGPRRRRLLSAVSFGSFGPAMVTARRA